MMWFKEPVLQTDIAERYNQQGLALKAEGRLDEAISAYRAGIAFGPSSLALYNNLGRSWTGANSMAP